jgi:hypothetical protein
MQAWPSLPDNHRSYRKPKEDLAMKRKIWLLALVAAVLLSAGSVLADSDMYVVAAGRGVGTRITSLPYPINSPGFYYVTGNLTCASGNGITVNSDDVTLDLMGFRLSGNSSSVAITWLDHSNIEVRNGTLRNWGTGVAAFHFSGEVKNNRVINLRSLNNNNIGISLGGGENSLVRGCTIDGGDAGIQTASVVANNVVVNCSSFGITSSGTISGNVVSNSGTGIKCSGGGVIGNTVYCGLGQTGIDLSTSTGEPIMMDQNTVSGAGTHYSGGSSATVWAGSSGATASAWGNNAGHP